MNKVTPKISIVNWKLTSIIAILNEMRMTAPVLPLKINAKIQAGEQITEETVASAYKACCSATNNEKPYMKGLDRLGFLRFELLLLKGLVDVKNIDPTVLDRVDAALDFKPVTLDDIDMCEIRLREAIHLLLPSEIETVKRTLADHKARANRGVMSNHAFNLVKLAKTSRDKEVHGVFENLIINQLNLLNLLVSYQGSLKKHIKRKFLKAAHWQPSTVDEARKLLLETNDLLESAASL